MYRELDAYVDARVAEFGEIGAERRAQLDEVAAHVRTKVEGGDTARLIFVCTHNSRRSHLAQLWASVGARLYGLPVYTYSGGTERTAFNPRAVAAVTRAGFGVERVNEDENPVYLVRMGADISPSVCFSKPYDNAPNPRAGFAAVMVCTDADEACPNVPGAEGRFALPYVDPKVSDGTAEEAATYDERCAQIAREMLYLMSRAAE